MLIAIARNDNDVTYPSSRDLRFTLGVNSVKDRYVTESPLVLEGGLPCA